MSLLKGLSMLQIDKSIPRALPSLERVCDFLLALGVSQDLEYSTSTLPLRYILIPFQLHSYQAPKPNTHSMSHKEMGLNTQTKTCEELGTIKKITNIKP